MGVAHWSELCYKQGIGDGELGALETWVAQWSTKSLHILITSFLKFRKNIVYSEQNIFDVGTHTLNIINGQKYPSISRVMRPKIL